MIVFEHIIYFLMLFSFATRAGSPQEREAITVGPYYLTPSQLSLWEETGVPGENLLSAECWLYSFHMRTEFESTLRWTLLGIELVASEVKGEWSDHYTTEAH